MASSSSRTMKLLATAPKVPTYIPPSTKKLLEISENLKSRLYKFRQAGFTKQLCERFQKLNKELEEVKEEIEKRTSKKGGKLTRKNNKIHKSKTRRHRNILRKN